MRWLILTPLLFTGYLHANCPEARYLPTGYTTGMRIDFRKISSYLKKNGVNPQDLRFFQQPGVGKDENWLQNLQYSDVDSAYLLTREREKDLLMVVCFSSDATLAKFKQQLQSQKGRIEKKSGKKFSYNEKTGEGEVDGGALALLATKRAFVVGDSSAMKRYKANYRAKKAHSSGLGGRLYTSKAEIIVSLDIQALGKYDTRDIPDFAGLRLLKSCKVAELPI